MNRQMNLPALQRIAMEFEKENDIMDQRQEMMDDAIDDATGMEDEEESEDDLGQAVRIPTPRHTTSTDVCRWARRPVGCRRRRLLRAGWHKQWAVEERILTMTICRRVWTV
jgi:hypothetical protein